MRIACIGECMIELSELADGGLSRGYGGDTLNTAVYLARLGAAVDYCTALGDDPFSDEMLEAWRAEGVGTGLVPRLPGRLPGLYLIRRDARGERSFFYWRREAPARELFDLPETPAIVEALTARDLLYLSGITLSLYGEAGRDRLLDALDRTRARGGRVAFDTNFRPRGWPDRAAAQAVYARAFAHADLVLASTEDLDLLFGHGQRPSELSTRVGLELVLKRPDLACRVRAPGTDVVVAAEPVEEVVDTTAAGDSFAAAYLAARLAGAEPAAAARAGHRLAGAVVRHPGAIIPRTAMPTGIVPGAPGAGSV